MMNDGSRKHETTKPRKGPSWCLRALLVICLLDSPALAASYWFAASTGAGGNDGKAPYDQATDINLAAGGAWAGAGDFSTGTLTAVGKFGSVSIGDVLYLTSAGDSVAGWFEITAQAADAVSISYLAGTGFPDASAADVDAPSDGPKDTVAACEALMASGDTIWLESGDTFEEDTVYFNLDTVTVAKYGDEADPIWNGKAGQGYIFGATGGTAFTIQDIALHRSAATRVCYVQNATQQTTFTRGSVDIDASTQGIRVLHAALGTGTLTVNGTEFSGGDDPDQEYIEAKKLASLEVTACDFTDEGIGVWLDQEVTLSLIHSNTLDDLDGRFVLVDADWEGIGHVRIYDNTGVSSNLAIFIPNNDCYDVGVRYLDFWLNNNTWTRKGDGTNLYTGLQFGVDDVYAANRIGPVTITDNTLSGETTDDSHDKHLTMLGGGVVNGYVARNRIYDANNFGQIYGIVLKCQGTTIEDNLFHGVRPVLIAGAKHCKVQSNSIWATVDAAVTWNRDSDDTGGQHQMDSDGTFTRASSVGDTNAAGVYATYTANVRRTRTQQGVSMSDGVVSTAQLAGGEDFVPQCLVEGLPKSSLDGLYGLNLDDESELVYLDNNGSYAVAKDLAADGLKSVYVVTLADGSPRLLVFADVNGVGAACYYSDDAETFTLAQLGGGNWVLTGYPSDNGWSLDQDDETLIAGLYTTVTDIRFYRSIDYGATWTLELDLDTDLGVSGDHAHSVAYHAGQDLWIADIGDADPDMFTVTSSDGGDTWALVDVGYLDGGGDPMSPTSQVTRFRDYGHATNMLMGCDAHPILATVDLTSWDVRAITDIPIGSDGALLYYVFDIQQYNGIWYAGVYSTQANGSRDAAIWVSDDLDKWTCYYRFADTFTGVVRFCGLWNDTLYALVVDNGVDKAFSISEATLGTWEGLFLAPGKTNLVQADEADCETKEDWWDGSVDTMSFDTVVFAEGAASMKLEHSSDREWSATILAADGPQLVADGDHYQGGYFRPGTGTFSVESRTAAAGASRCTSGARAGWNYIAGRVATLAAGPQDIAVQFRGKHRLAAGNTCWLDAVDVHAAPLQPGWIAGGSSIAAESITFAETPSNAWTHIYSVRIYGASDELGGGSLYLFSYDEDDADYIEVYLDAADSNKIKLTDDVPTATIESSAPDEFTRGTRLRVAVRYMAGRVALSVDWGEGAEHVTSFVSRADDIYGTLDIVAGDEDGAGVLPGWYGDSVLYDYALSEAELDEIFAQPTNGTARDPRGNLLKDNILVAGGTSTNCLYDTGEEAYDAFVDYNLYYASGTGAKLANLDGTTYDADASGLAALQAKWLTVAYSGNTAGRLNDANSVTGDPLFRNVTGDIDNDDWAIKWASPARAAASVPYMDIGAAQRREKIKGRGMRPGGL